MICKCPGVKAVNKDAIFKQNSRGIIFYGVEGEEEGEGPDGYCPGVAVDDDGRKPAEAQPVDGRVERLTGAGVDGEPQAIRGVSTDSDGEFADDEANAANNKYASCCIHEDESGSPAGPPRPHSVSTAHAQECGIQVLIEQIQSSRGGSGPTSTA